MSLRSLQDTHFDFKNLVLKEDENIFHIHSKKNRIENYLLQKTEIVGR